MIPAVHHRGVISLLLLLAAGCTDPPRSAIYDLSGTFLYSRETTVGCCPSVSSDSFAISSPITAVLRLKLDHEAIVGATLDSIACSVCGGETVAQLIPPSSTVADSVSLRLANSRETGNPRFTVVSRFSGDEVGGSISWEYYSSGSRVRAGTFVARRR